MVGVAAGGLLDIIDDGVNGFLVSNTDDVIEFSERTRQLVQDSELRRRVGAQGREYAQLWSWESATSVLRNIQYPKAIENFRQKCQAKEAKVAAERTQAEAVQQEKANLYRPDLA